MRGRALERLSAAAVMVIGLAGLSLGAWPAALQPSSPSTPALPRTPWGHPDLQGIWDGKTQTPLQRPERYAGREFLTDDEVTILEKRTLEDRGRDLRPEKGSLLDVAEAYNNIWNSSYGAKVVRTKRTSLIVDPPDGKLPALTAVAQKRVDADREFTKIYGRVSEVSPGGPTDNPEDRPQDRCSGMTLPCIGALCAFSRIVQSPEVISIYYESGHYGGSYRHIPLDGRPHLPPGVRQWLGDARGRWEGETLVVETRNFTSQTSFQGSGENLQLTERFTRTAPDLIIYRATVLDSTVFTKPWTLEMTLTLQNGKANKIFEGSCHEGNYAMTNVLTGARVASRTK